MGGLLECVKKFLLNGLSMMLALGLCFVSVLSLLK